MALPFYVSPEQFMRDKAEYARKGIARGKSVIALDCREGLAFVAENPSAALHKVSEIYDRIAFAGVGRFNEFESLRIHGIRQADMQGYNYAREDVTARALANTYSQILGQIFTAELKPFEVEILVAQVGDGDNPSEMYHILYDGSPNDEQHFVAMGGKDEELKAYLERNFREELSFDEAVRMGTSALREVEQKEVPHGDLEVAILDKSRDRRKFRRLPDPDIEVILSGT